MAVAAQGLTQQEVIERRAAGRMNVAHDATSRSVGDIFKANLLTRFNAILGSMLVVILIVGPIQDALFGLILIANAVIGIAQELRAKVTLDRLAIVGAPVVTVIRDGVAQKVQVAEVVQDELVQAAAGDEIVVDGTLQTGTPIEINEALLTGEAAPVVKTKGDEVLAGSFVASGEGCYVAVRVGDATYARRLTAEARRFQLVRSELMRGINQILRVVTWMIVPTALLLAVSQLRAYPSLADAARGVVAGVITMVPEGLVLLTSASLALAVIRLGRRGVLVQQLPAVEMLARADVVCFDKTGTLTEAEMTVAGVDPLGEARDWCEALGAMARVDARPNASMRAIGETYAAPQGWIPDAIVPFSSDRKWSAVHFEQRGWWVIGAPDVLNPAVTRTPQPDRRELLLGRASRVDRQGLDGFEPAALVALEETIKSDAATTVSHLVEQGVAIKLISGDHPSTVAAIGGRVGLPDLTAVDGRELPAAEQELAQVVETATVFGRVTPEQKRDLVRALRSAGHTVAMTGDGVNDILALKEADLGIAMGGASSAARAIAACILTDGSFAGLPAVLAEGRRVIGNVERLASLFFTKTVYAFLIAVAVGLATLPFPFLPRQLTLISAFTIGIPSVFLTFAHTFEPSKERFLPRVLRFAIPVGVVAGAATFLAYTLAVAQPSVSIAEERTAATLVIAATGLWVLVRLIRPLTESGRVLVLAMAAGLGAALVLPAARDFFELDLPPLDVLVAAAGIVAIAIGAIELADRGVDWAAGRIDGIRGQR
jgi:magnesium-transporting ATPase (P-type)